MRQVANIPSAQRASLSRGIALPFVCHRLAPSIHPLRTADTKHFSTSGPLRATAESAQGFPEPAAAPPPQQPVPAATPSGARSNEASPEPEATLRRTWRTLLGELHTHGYFGDVDEAGLSRAMSEPNAVKTALLNFARARADILFSLPAQHLATLAAAELPLARSGERMDRKVRNADRRLKVSYGGAKAAAAAAQQQQNAHEKASLQDLLRVVWEWVEEGEQQAEAAGKGLLPALHGLLSSLRTQLPLPPDPEALEAARGLATPTAAALAERAAAAEGETKTKASAFLDKKHASRIRAAVEYGRVLYEGDWFCGSCGAQNYGDKERCFRCATPSSAKGVSVVSADDVASLYGDKAPRRRERTAVAAEEADAMYDATVAATAARREGRGGAAYGEREQRRGPAAAAVGGRGRLGRRAAVHLEDEEGDAKAGGGVSGGWRERGGRPGPGQRQRQEYEGRPGLRRRATRDEDGDDDEAGGRAGPRGWGGDEDGPDEQQQEVRASEGYRLRLSDFYGRPPPEGSSSVTERDGDRDGVGRGGRGSDRDGGRGRGWDRDRSRGGDADRERSRGGSADRRWRRGGDADRERDRSRGGDREFTRERGGRGPGRRDDGRRDAEASRGREGGRGAGSADAEWEAWEASEQTARSAGPVRGRGRARVQDLGGEEGEGEGAVGRGTGPREGEGGGRGPGSRGGGRGRGQLPALGGRKRAPAAPAAEE